MVQFAGPHGPWSIEKQPIEPENLASEASLCPAAWFAAQF